MIHYTDKAISKWERGQSFPKDPELLDKIAHELDLSIAELLYGEKRNNFNDKKMSEHFIGLYKKSYQKYINMIYIVLSIVLLSIVILLVSTYFIFIKNKIASYTLSGESTNFLLSNSTLLLTNKINTLNLSEVKIKNDVINPDDINYIRLYYVKNDEINLIMEGKNDSYYIEELHNYKEYNLNEIIKYDTYFEVCYNDNQIETIKIAFSNKFINDTIFTESSLPIGYDDNKKDNDAFLEVLLNEDFVYGESGYEKRINDVYLYFTEPDILMVQRNKDGVVETLKAKMSSEDIIYTMIDEKGNTDTIVYNLSEKLDFNLEDEFKREYINYIKYLQSKYN